MEVVPTNRQTYAQKPTKFSVFFRTDATESFATTGFFTCHAPETHFSTRFYVVDPCLINYESVYAVRRIEDVGGGGRIGLGDGDTLDTVERRERTDKGREGDNLAPDEFTTID